MTPMRARLEDVNAVTIQLAEPTRNDHLRMLVISPSRVDRATGSLRSPEAAVDLPSSVVADVVAAVTAGFAFTAPASVVGLLVHVVSRRATAVGVFGSAEEATGWWAQPFNRLAHNPDVVFCLIAVEQAP